MADHTTPILHHFDTSPFSEKVRLAFRIKGLDWAGVDIPSIMPKPDYVPLTGGYRKTPALQIGADIYCDSRLAIDELERRYPDPSLGGPRNEYVLLNATSSWADKSWFNATVAVVFGELADGVPEEFKKDREKMSGRPFDPAALKAASPVMKPLWKAHWLDVEKMLADTGTDFLAGDVPTITDINFYYNVWFAKSFVPEAAASLMKGATHALKWVECMEAISGGTKEVLDSKDALKIASDATPLEPIDSLCEYDKGTKLIVMADDYGQDPIEGSYVASTRNSVTLARERDDLGLTHVHFPKIGFIVRPA